MNGSLQQETTTSRQFPNLSLRDLIPQVGLEPAEFADLKEFYHSVYQQMVEQLFDSRLANIPFLLLEILGIIRSEGHATTILRSSLSDAERQEYVARYFNVVDTLREKRGWSISMSDNLYYSGQILAARVETNPEARIPDESPSWFAQTGKLRWKYAESQSVSSEQFNSAFQQYIELLQAIRIDAAPYFYVILIPISLNSFWRRYRVKLGALFLHFASYEEYDNNELLKLYQKTIHFWHHYFTAEALQTYTDRTQALERYRDLTQLIHRPLSELTNALGALQRETQELRAIFYDPAQAIFETMPIVSEFFEEGKLLCVGRDRHIRIEHEPNSYPPNAAADVLAAAVCRILGYTGDFREVSCSDGLMSLVRMHLHESRQTRHLKRVCDDLDYLLNEITQPEAKCYSLGLDGLFSEQKAQDIIYRRALKRLKDCVFTPFKVDDANWSVLPIRLILRCCGRGGGEPNASSRTQIVDRADHIVMRLEWTPINFNTVLEFFCAITSLCIHSEESVTHDRAYIEHYEFVNDDDHFEVAVQFNQKLSRLLDLREKVCDYIARVLAFPRDWRIISANLGDSSRPFVELASRLAVIGKTGRWHYCEPKGDEVLRVVTNSGSNGESARMFALSLGEQPCEVRLVWTPKT